MYLEEYMYYLLVYKLFYLNCSRNIVLLVSLFYAYPPTPLRIVFRRVYVLFISLLVVLFEL